MKADPQILGNELRLQIRNKLLFEKSSLRSFCQYLMKLKGDIKGFDYIKSKMSSKILRFSSSIHLKNAITQMLLFPMMIWTQMRR